MTSQLWLCGGVGQSKWDDCDWLTRNPQVLPLRSWAAVPGAGARPAPAPPAPRDAFRWWLWQLPVALWRKLPVAQLPVAPPAGNERLSVPGQEPRVCPGGPGLPVHTDVWCWAAGLGEYSQYGSARFLSPRGHSRYCIKKIISLAPQKQFFLFLFFVFNMNCHKKNLERMTFYLSHDS